MNQRSDGGKARIASVSCSNLSMNCRRLIPFSRERAAFLIKSLPSLHSLKLSLWATVSKQANINVSDNSAVAARLSIFSPARHGNPEAQARGCSANPRFSFGEAKQTHSTLHSIAVGHHGGWGSRTAGICGYRVRRHGELVS